jgi:hypothetical protein
MHRPGYVQGGQEANRGYLLLGVHHRRIHSDTVFKGGLGDFCFFHAGSQFFFRFFIYFCYLLYCIKPITAG